MTRFIVGYELFGFHTRLIDVDAKKPNAPAVKQAAERLAHSDRIRFIRKNDGTMLVGDYTSREEWEKLCGIAAEADIDTPR
jgi:hypothetical protein